MCDRSVLWSAIRRYTFKTFKTLQVKSFQYVNIQFHRVVWDESVNYTLIKRNYKFKPPQFNETMTTKLFKHYCSMYT